MRDCSCPFACPFALGGSVEFVCICAGFGAVVPAKDLRRLVPLSDFGPGGAVTPARSMQELRGEVVTCPVVSPFAWLSSNPLPTSPSAYVPANGGPNILAPRADGGGR
jgi:hypothetical protein